MSGTRHPMEKNEGAPGANKAREAMPKRRTRRSRSELISYLFGLAC